MKFVPTKDVEKLKIKISIIEKKDIEPKSKAKGKSLPKSQRWPQVKHFVTIMAFKGTQDQIALSLTLLKGLILCMLKEMKEESQEESKVREKMMVNSLEMSWKFLRTSHHA